MDSILTRKQASSPDKPKENQGELKGKPVQSEKKLSPQSIAASRGWELAPKRKMDEKSVFGRLILSPSDLSSDSENLKLARAGKNGIKIRVETTEDIAILKDFISDPYNTFFLRRLEVVQVGDINEGNIEAVQGLLDELGKNGEYLNRLSLFSCGRIDIDRDVIDFSNKFLFLKDLPSIRYFSFGEVINSIILGMLEKLQAETHRPHSPFDQKDTSLQIEKYLPLRGDLTKNIKSLTRASADLSNPLIVLSCYDLISDELDARLKMQFVISGNCSVKIKFYNINCVRHFHGFISDKDNVEFLKRIKVIQFCDIDLKDVEFVQNLLDEIGKKGEHFNKLCSLVFMKISTFSPGDGLFESHDISLNFPGTLNNLSMISFGDVSNIIHSCRDSLVRFNFPEKSDAHIDFSCGKISECVRIECSGNSLRSFSCGDCGGSITFLGDNNLEAIACGDIYTESSFKGFKQWVAGSSQFRSLGIMFEHDPRVLAEISCGNIFLAEIPKDFLFFKELPNLVSLNFNFRYFELTKYFYKLSEAKAVDSLILQRIKELQAKIKARKENS